MELLSGLFAGILNFLTASAVAGVSLFGANTTLSTAEPAPIVESQAVAEITLPQDTSSYQLVALVATSSVANTLFDSTSAAWSEAEFLKSLNARFAGLLSHTRWLINDSERVEVVSDNKSTSRSFIDKQIERTTDSIGDSIDTVSEELEANLSTLDTRMVSAEATLANLSIAAASSSIMAANLNLNGHWLSGDGDDEGVFVDVNGRVGIGISTPSSLLSVNGNASFGDSFNEVNATRPINLVSTNATMRVWRYSATTTSFTNPAVELIQGTNDIAGSNENTYWDFYTVPGSSYGADSFRIRQRTGGLNINALTIAGMSGNVGIGTTTPSSKLTVHATAGQNPFSIASSTGETLFTVLGNGNVGVGTRTPASLFSVGGSALVAGTLSVNNLEVINTAAARNNLGLSFASVTDVTETPKIAVWGDSLTAGAGASPAITKSFPAQLAAITGYIVYNGGVGGETSTQIKSRFDADTEKHTWPTIFWVGRNDGSDYTTIKSNIAAMVASLGHEKYLVLDVINSNSEPVGSIAHTGMVALSEDLQEIYGSHYVGIRDYLVSQYDPDIPQDVIDYANDVPPTSLSADGLHLNNAGYLAVAQRIKDSITVLVESTATVATPQLLSYFLSNPTIIGSTTPNRAYFSSLGVGTTTVSTTVDMDGGLYLGKIRMDLRGFDSDIKMYASRGAGLDQYSPWSLHANSGASQYFSIRGGPSSALGSESLSDLFTIRSSGNVGIGTSVPNALLEIASSTTDGTEFQALRISRPTNTTGTDGARISFANFSGSDSRAAEIAAIREGGSFSTSLAFRTNTGTSLTSISEVLRISGSGRVGIGLTNPATRLHLAMAASSTVYDVGMTLQSPVTSTGVTPAIAFSTTLGANPMTAAAIDGTRDSGGYGGGFRIHTQDSVGGILRERLRINSQGNVGIGTTTLTSRLTIQATGTTDILNLFETGGAEVFTVLENGNIGIGTTTPNNLLQVYDLVEFDNTDLGTQLGYQAGKNLVFGAQYNTFLGYQAGYSSSTDSTNAADNNTGIGYRTLYNNTTGSNNTANGASSLYNNTTGGNNTAYGVSSLHFNTSGNNNTANGVQALNFNTTGYNNTAIGRDALRFNTTGSLNTASGYQALFSNTTGNFNTAFGANAGQYLTDAVTAASTTDYSLFLGYNTKALTANDQNTIVIGYDANSLGSNTVVLGNDSIVTTALKGKVGIGTNAPEALLHILANSDEGDVGLRIENTSPTVPQYPQLLISRHNQFGGFPAVIFENTNGSKATPTAVSSSGSLGAILFRGYNGTAMRQTAAIGAASETDFTASSTPTYLNFNTTAPGSITNAERMRITGSGNLGIGTTTPSEKLTVVGTIQSTTLLGGSTNLTTDASGNIIRDPSDARLKENVTTIENALDTVLALRGVRYEWIDKERFGDQFEIGFIAQEVDELVPEVVQKGGEYWSLNSKNLVAVVVEAVKEMWEVVTGQGEKINELEARWNENQGVIEELKAQNTELKNRLEAVEGELNIENTVDPNTLPPADEAGIEDNTPAGVPEAIEEQVEEGDINNNGEGSNVAAPETEAVPVVVEEIIVEPEVVIEASASDVGSEGGE